MKVVILAGGSGTRLFPLSRKCYPKQFLKIAGKKSLLAQTMERFLTKVQPKDIIIVTNGDYKFIVEEIDKMFYNYLQPERKYNLLVNMDETLFAYASSINLMLFLQYMNYE